MFSKKLISLFGKIKSHMYFTKLGKDNIKISYDKWAKDTTEVFQTMNLMPKNKNMQLCIKRNVNQKKLPSNFETKISLAG